MNVIPMPEGKTTIEALIPACQCGAVAFEIQSTSRTAVTLTCAQCGLRTSVKSAVARVRVRSDEVAYALEHTLTRPDAGEDASDPAADPAHAGDPDPAAPPIETYTTLRFRIGAGRPVIDAAMEVCRIEHLGDPGVREQVWQGLILERICADYLAGADPRALAVYKEMEDALAAARAALPPGSDLPTRRRRNLWADTRDRAAARVGLVPTEIYCAPDPTGEEVASRQDYAAATAAKIAANAAEDRREERTPLVQWIGEILAEITQTALDQGSPAPGYLVGAVHRSTSFEAHRAAAGGMLLQFTGDPRTRTAQGLAPRALVYTPDLDRLPDLAGLYRDAWAADLPDAHLTMELL